MAGEFARLIREAGSAENLHRIFDPRDFSTVIIPQEELLQLFDLCDAYWFHSGDPKQPHAKTTKDLCTNGFFDCLAVLQYVKFSELLANQHALRIRREIGDRKITRTLGSPMAAITYAHDLARAIGAPISNFVEKDPDNSGKMLWKRRQILPGESVLQAEELITTAGTSDEVRWAVMKDNKTPVNFLPYLAVLVHRPPKMVTHYGERRVIAVIEQEVWAVPQSECKLCAAGSERLPPKQSNNWARLKGRA